MKKEDKELLRERVTNCEAIAWDTCHKIYVLMDEKEVEKMRGYGYTSLIESKYVSPAILSNIVLYWYKKSCGLKFINAVNNDQFETIVPQR